MLRGTTLDIMERDAIEVLKPRGFTTVATGATLGCHRATVAGVLGGPVEIARVRDRGNQVDHWRPQIETWVTRGTPVRRITTWLASIQRCRRGVELLTLYKSVDRARM